MHMLNFFSINRILSQRKTETNSLRLKKFTHRGFFYRFHEETNNESVPIDRDPFLESGRTKQRVFPSECRGFRKAAGEAS